MIRPLPRPKRPTRLQASRSWRRIFVPFVIVTRTEIAPDGQIILFHGPEATAPATRLMRGGHAAMRVKLKGLNKVTTRLKSGKTVTYYYARNGGPRLSGAYGSAEFHASYADAARSRRLSATDVMRSLLDKYEDSSEFTDLTKRTRADYRKHLRVIDAEFGDFPLTALSDRRTRGEFMAWRDRLAVKPTGRPTMRLPSSLA